jgi:hypothetical protein
LQFQCGSCGYFKTYSSLQKHLQLVHKIYVSLSYATHKVRTPDGHPILAGPHVLKLPKNIKDFGFTRRNSPYIYSKQRYICYNCGAQRFKTLIHILHHLDIKHNIHISYIKGISNKKVFLDGI